MNQPELGKKIAELRKAKGLTQEELVEKCNLNVRTLQRIESGEVTPRSYTIKLIFTALDYSVYDSTESKRGFQISYWIEQFYRYVLDLFNLKTKTMKKITILSLMLLSIVFGLFTLVLDGKAQDKINKTTPILEKEELNNQSDTKMIEGNFSCKNCFYDNDDMIGYGVKFKKDGVSVNVQLIKLNRNTGKFNAGFVKGVFLSNKVEVAVDREWIDKRIVTFSADDSLEKLEDKIVLKGHAKLISSQNEIIEANEIIILLE
jgi:transcriptional regulator with XRE-family HTH domain